MTILMTDDQDRKLQALAATFPYPPTPEIGAAVRRRLLESAQPISRSRPARLLAGALALLVLLLVATLLVPQVRAAVFELLQIGAVRIHVLDPGDPTPAPATAISPQAATLLDLAGETTLAAAYEQAGFPLRLPTYPPELGSPDRVFLQELTGNDGIMVIFVWFDPDRPGEPRLTLYQTGAPFYGIKEVMQDNLQETSVNGRPAYWVRRAHRLQLQSGRYRYDVLVPGDVLIWSDGTITYRLESGLPLSEAVRIAESLQ